MSILSRRVAQHLVLSFSISPLLFASSPVISTSPEAPTYTAEISDTGHIAVNHHHSLIQKKSKKYPQELLTRDQIADFTTAQPKICGALTTANYCVDKRNTVTCEKVSSGPTCGGLRKLNNDEEGRPNFKDLTVVANPEKPELSTVSLEKCKKMCEGEKVSGCCLFSKIVKAGNKPEDEEKSNGARGLCKMALFDTVDDGGTELTGEEFSTRWVEDASELKNTNSTGRRNNSGKSSNLKSNSPNQSGTTDSAFNCVSERNDDVQRLQVTCQEWDDGLQKKVDIPECVSPEQ